MKQKPGKGKKEKPTGNTPNRQKQTNSANRELLLFNKGVKAEKSGHFHLALKIYKLVLKTSPGFRETYINLGNLLFKMGKFRLALVSFKKALLLKKDFIIYFNLGVLFFRIRRYRSAAFMLKQSIKFNKEYIRAYLLLGFSFSQKGETRNAEIAYQNVLKLQPQQPQAIYALTYLYCNQKKYESAYPFIKKLLLIDPNSDELQNLYAKISFHSFKNSSDIEKSEKFLFQNLEKMIREQRSFQEYNEFIIKSQNEEPEKYKKLNSDIDKKINLLKKSFQKENSLDSQKWMDLSLYYLFRGNSQKAVRALCKARAQISA